MVQSIKTELRLTIALDCSGSMYNENKLNWSKKAVIDLLTTFRNMDNIAANVAIYQIGEDRGWVGGRFYNESEFSELIPMIDRVEAGGQTPLYDSLVDIFEYYEQNKNNNSYNLVILVSDGREESDDTVNQFIDVQNALMDAECYFAFIGYGDREEYKDYEILVQNSTIPTEAYFPNMKPKFIVREFQKFFRKLFKRYNIYWKSSSAENGEQVDVEMKLVYKSVDGAKIETRTNFKYKSK